MQIGEFAKACQTKVSVLRHYDNKGLLKPDFIDKFTGYRYYSAEQIETFRRISALQRAGFSLAQIKKILTDRKNNKEIMKMFDAKKTELNGRLYNLEEAKKMMLQSQQKSDIEFIKEDNKLIARSKPLSLNNLKAAYNSIDNAISAEGYQRISAYGIISQPKGDFAQLTCDIIKLQESEITLNENIDIPFENDDSIVGKWETIGEFAVKEDFFSGNFTTDKTEPRNIYFLPGGEKYWCYGWSKNKLLINTGTDSSVNHFTTDFHNGERYMFVDLKSYNYIHGGKTTVLVLRQVNNIVYSAEEIARKDNIKMPFVNDESVLGKWKAVAFCENEDEFDPLNLSNNEFYFSEIEFKHDGEVISRYNYGKETIGSRDMQEWTKGFVLRKWNETACAYKIKKICGKEYLIIQWKSGNYRWGGFDTDYYIFERK